MQVDIEINEATVETNIESSESLKVELPHGPIMITSGYISTGILASRRDASTFACCCTAQSNQDMKSI